LVVLALPAWALWDLVQEVLAEKALELSLPEEEAEEVFLLLTGVLQEIPVRTRELQISEPVSVIMEAAEVVPCSGKGQMLQGLVKPALRLLLDSMVLEQQELHEMPLAWLELPDLVATS
jgi:hypothetical protein